MRGRKERERENEEGKGEREGGKDGGREGERGGGVRITQSHLTPSVGHAHYPLPFIAPSHTTPCSPSDQSSSTSHQTFDEFAKPFSSPTACVTKQEANYTRVHAWQDCSFTYSVFM